MLRGSTLAETLVMMLVAGIVFLATMEALTLVSRLVARRAADTLEIDVGSHMLKLPVLRPARESYGRRIAEIEKDHGYEEP